LQVLVAVRRDGDAALFIFEWEGESKPLALRIDLSDTSEEFHYRARAIGLDDPTGKGARRVQDTLHRK
jgi:hypothetical protein